jgi:hypothetical protein
MNLPEAVEEVRRLSRLLDAGLDVLRSSAEETASAEREYRKGKALAWVHRTDGTAAERVALVDADTADLRYTRDVAEGIRRAALESVRARSTQVSMWQTLLNAHRAEAEFTRTRPGDAA